MALFDGAAIALCLCDAVSSAGTALSAIEEFVETVQSTVDLPLTSCGVRIRPLARLGWR